MPAAFGRISGNQLRILSFRGVDTWTARDVFPARLTQTGPAPKGIEAGPLRLFRKASWQLFRFLYFQLVVAVWRPDVVHIWFDERPLGLVRLAVRGRRAVFIKHVHDAYSHDVSRRSGTWSCYERLEVNRANYLTTFSEYVKTIVCERFGAPEAKVVVVDMFPEDVGETSQFASPAEYENGHSDDHEVSEKIKVLVFGTLRRNKGIDLVVAALRKIPDSIAIDVHIAGRVASDIDESLLECLRSDDRVTLELCSVTDERKRELFAKSHYILLPYHDFFGESAVLRDAIAYQRVPICSDLPQFSFVSSSGIGVQFRSGDSDALAEIFIDIASGRIDSSEFVGPLSLVSDSNSPDITALKLTEIYQRILLDRSQEN